jgi:hypothetical protein
LPGAEVTSLVREYILLSHLERSKTGIHETEHNPAVATANKLTSSANLAAAHARGAAVEAEASALREIVVARRSARRMMMVVALLSVLPLAGAGAAVLAGCIRVFSAPS